jgi:hypothetical protein
MTHENLQFWAWQVTEQGCKTHTPPPLHPPPKKKTERKREKKDEKRNEKCVLQSAHEHKLWTLVR